VRFREIRPQVILAAAYLTVMTLLAVYGFHRALLVWLYHRHRASVPAPAARFAPDRLPTVTVQLPLYNEMYVAERLLDAVAAVRWPRDKLEIQVLDDSTDETVAILERKVAELKGRGLDVQYLHRRERTGFKAGALAHGLRQARGELLLVFDADFLPGPEILEAMVDHFTDPRVGMVQARWDHINRDYSVLTETQALLLDGHFVIEHGARCRAGRFFNFSGTAGIWRRAAIEDAGGWNHDTLTEDMDLSYRAQLQGWRFVFLPQVTAPAELPVEMNAFKSQQFRWAKGQMQVARKLLPTILRARLPLSLKLEAFFHLTNNVAYPLLLLLCALLLPNLLSRHPGSLEEVLLIDVPLFFGTTLSIASFYLVSQRELGRGLGRALLGIPCLMALCTGLCVNQGRAVVEALVGRDSGFVRTPKHGVRRRREPWHGKKYRAARTWVPAIELAFAGYFVAAIVVAARTHCFLTVPFLVTFALGFAYVGGLSWLQRR
jgi:cellulose synthase/poly-beta-1,6-N-acetylglucosamine synthase-like glycosyltransferase